MNCRDVQEILNGSPNAKSIGDDAALRAHLDICPVCATQFERAHRLEQILHAAAVDDTDYLKSPAALQVETIARLAHRQSEHHRRWRRYALGTITAVALVVIGLSAPWHIERADGYKLAVNGVSVELAGDHERLCDMLFALGAVNAGVDVGECDTTCEVVIFDLRTRDEARLVEAAIRNLSPGDVTVDVIPVRYRSAES